MPPTVFSSLHQGGGGRPGQKGPRSRSPSLALAPRCAGFSPASAPFCWLHLRFLPYPYAGLRTQGWSLGGRSPELLRFPPPQAARSCRGAPAARVQLSLEGTLWTGSAVRVFCHLLLVFLIPMWHCGPLTALFIFLTVKAVLKWRVTVVILRVYRVEGARSPGPFFSSFSDQDGFTHHPFLAISV